MCVWVGVCVFVVCVSVCVLCVCECVCVGVCVCVCCVCESVCVLLLVDPLLKHGTAAFYPVVFGHGGVAWSFSVLPGRLQII